MTLETGVWKLDAGKNPEAGFALLVAVIFMSVMLAFALMLGSLAYKQTVLSSSAIQSQYAFYAADAGLECALYADQQLGTFRTGTSETLSCSDQLPVASVAVYGQNGTDYYKATLELEGNTRCAVIDVHKYPAPVGGFTTYIFSQGYDVSCDIVSEPPANARFFSRGLQAHY